MENNLKKTKEKIHKQKEKEQAKITGKPVPAETPDAVIEPSDISIKIKKDQAAKEQKTIRPEDI